MTVGLNRGVYFCLFLCAAGATAFDWNTGGGLIRGDGMPHFRKSMLHMIDEFERDMLSLPSVWGPVPRPRLHGEALQRIHSLSVDVAETETEFRVVADLPGVRKEDITIEVEGNVLSLTAERTINEEEKHDKYHRVERAYGEIQRSIRLPENADLENVNATFVEGVLRVTIPKGERKPKKCIEIS